MFVTLEGPDGSGKSTQAELQGAMSAWATPLPVEALLIGLPSEFSAAAPA